MTEPNRYARHIVLPEVGAAGQARLAASSVLIVGLGGLGCPAAQYLASSGVGRLVLNDFDAVDVTNLPRQVLFTDADVGQTKVTAAAARLSQLNPELAIETIDQRCDSARLVSVMKHVDAVLDGTDNLATRFAVNDACVAAQVPLVSGAAIRLEGQVVTFLNRSGGGPCYRCIYSEDDEWLGDCQGSGVLAPVTGVIGALMAMEAIQVLLGKAESRANVLSLWDAKTGVWNRVAIKPSTNCPNCG